MKIDRKELKRLARQRMKAAPIHPMLVTLVFGLVFCGSGTIVSMVLMVPMSMLLSVSMIGMGNVGSMNPEAVTRGMLGPFLLMYFVLLLVVMLVTAILRHGYVSYSLHVADGVESGCGDIFAGFPRIGRVIPMNFALAGFYLLWCLAILLPGTLLMMVAFLLMNTGSRFLGGLLVFIIYAAIAVLLMLVTMRYLFCDHALADDPKIGPLNAIRRSRALMKGRSGEGFLLQLSFIGWSLIPVGIYLVVVMVGTALALGAANPAVTGLTILLGMIVGLLSMVPFLLWLYPYISTTISLYYRALSPRAPAEGDEPSPLPDPNTPWRSEGGQ